jgi:hypothetical protein
MLFSASIRLQLHTIIQVGKEYQLKNIAVGEIPPSQQIADIMVPSLINSAAEFRKIRPCFDSGSQILKRSLSALKYLVQIYFAVGLFLRKKSTAVV